MNDDFATTKAGRALERRVRQLPAGVTPDHDLWPGIRARIDARATPQHTPPDSRLSRATPHLLRLAAAVALVMGSSLTTLWLAGERFAGQVVVVDSRQTLQGVERATMDPMFLESRYQLSVGLEDQFERMSPETRRVVERNLQEIRHGLNEIRRALAQDPANEALQQLLVGAYQDELRYLNDIQRLAGNNPRRSDI